VSFLTEEWQDFDGAQYELGRALGLFKDQTFQEVKHVFWTSNPVGDCLSDMLICMAEAGLLERDADEMRFRAKSSS
jgi:hypothetical protein